MLERDNSNPDDFIDRLVIDIPTPARGLNLPQTDYTGVFGIATLNISISVTCPPGFTGEGCEVNINECEVTTCGQNQECVDGILNFTCQCVPNFIGPDCMFEKGNREHFTLIVVISFISGITIVIGIVLCVFCIIMWSKKKRKIHTPSFPTDHDYSTLVRIFIILPNS